MTDVPQQTEPDPEEVVDTTDGSRDPLTTDDGLIAISAQMPQVPEDRVATDPLAEPDPKAPSSSDPELDIAEDGTDPLAAYAPEEG